MIEDFDFHNVRSTSEVPGPALIVHVTETLVADGDKAIIQVHL